MRFLRQQIVLAGLVFSLSNFSIAQQAAHWRASQAYDLHGPVHTQLNTSKMLEKDPRTEARLFIRQQAGWLEFDSNGQLIGEGQVDASGNVLSVSRKKYNPDGEEVETTLSQPEKTVRFRVERAKNPAGANEVMTFSDGQLQTRTVSSFDENTGAGESRVFDKTGALVHRSVTHFAPLQREQEIWGADGKLIMHSLDRFDEKGAHLASLRYDAEGRTVSELDFADGVLTSWWQDPNCKCTNGAGFTRPGESTVMYQTSEAGTLTRIVQHHQGRPGNLEIDDEELFDDAGRLLERVAYAYERDQQGNWTKRTVSVLDVNSGAVVPVREDDRKITYF